MSNHWYIVTNTENLIHFINYGLIIDKQGFASSSYLTDAMKETPLGYIPCFTAECISSALTKAKIEDPNLRGCLLEIDPNQINNMQAWGGLVNAENSTIDNQASVSIDTLMHANYMNCVLLPAPLPFNLIKNIIFQDKETCEPIKELFYQNFHSWPTKKSFFTIKSSLFNKSKKNTAQDSYSNDLLESNHNWQPSPRHLNYQRAFSYGGALGLLYYQTKNGQETTKAFETLGALAGDDNINTGSHDRSSSSDSIIAPFMSYLAGFQSSKTGIDTLYQHLIDELILVDDHGVACELILSELKSEHVPEQYKEKCVKLSKSLERIIDRTADKDPETILQIIINELYTEDIDFKHFAFLITLFFLRDHVETLLKYHHSSFTENHYMLLALFFGLTSGYVNIPDDIKRNYNLSLWLSFKMAEYMHNFNDRAIIFKAPVKPLLLHGDLIKQKPSKNPKIHNFYEWLDKYLYPNREEIIQPLIEWKISLPKRYTVENHKYLISEGKPDVLATIDNVLLANDMQKRIQADELFSLNVMTAAYKKFTK